MLSIHNTLTKKQTQAATSTSLMYTPCKLDVHTHAQQHTRTCKRTPRRLCHARRGRCPVAAQARAPRRWRLVVAGRPRRGCCWRRLPVSAAAARARVVIVRLHVHAGVCWRCVAGVHRGRKARMHGGLAWVHRRLRTTGRAHHSRQQKQQAAAGRQSAGTSQIVREPMDCPFTPKGVVAYACADLLAVCAATRPPLPATTPVDTHLPPLKR